MSSKTVTVRPNTEWYDQSIHEQKVKRRRLERKAKKSGSPSDLLKLRTQAKYVNSLCDNAKKVYHRNKIIQVKTDTRKLFNTAKILLHGKADPVYPTDSPPLALPNKFAEFFRNKVLNIHSSIKSGSIETDCFVENAITSKNLRSFQNTSDDEISKLIRQSSNAYCKLDPLPTSLLKQCSSELTPFITKLVNMSLDSAIVPAVMKEAIVVPLLKKSGLDTDDYKNFRPVSNLSFLSKICEKVVADQLKTYIAENGLAETFQSAYRRYHSTETALLRVHNDVMRALDDKNMVVLVLLDLSAAFDTLDHGILLDRLSTRFGITDDALRWIRSYLEDRSQRISVNGIDSDRIKLDIGVPQGSVLGPLLFSLYTTPLADIIKRHCVDYHFYADDTQLYISFNNSDLRNKIDILENCIIDIKQWMKLNFLKLNDDKTEVLLIGSKCNIKKVSSISLNINDVTISSSSNVKNLGAIFDSEMSLQKFVSFKCKCAMYYLRAIAQIRHFLDVDATRTLIQALVISRIDYANSLLIGVSKSCLHRLQLVQNSAARLITRTSRREHITPILFQLHWLPVEFRVRFKILVLCFNCLQGTAPDYLIQLIQFYKPGRTLRSSSQNFLHTSKSFSKFGDRSFAIYAPKEWNKLPVHIRHHTTIGPFRRDLKTFLFRQHFNC